jgi:hypothetical protein
MEPPKPDPKISGRIAGIVLVLMFAFVGVMVWIGG